MFQIVSDNKPSCDHLMTIKQLRKRQNLANKTRQPLTNSVVLPLNVSQLTRSFLIDASPSGKKPNIVLAATGCGGGGGAPKDNLSPNISEVQVSPPQLIARGMRVSVQAKVTDEGGSGVREVMVYGDSEVS
jgi:hypothetical protein